MKITGKGNFGVFQAGTLIVAALLLLLSPTDGRALTTCSKTAATICQGATAPSTADCDGDGFTDYEECINGGFWTVGSSIPDPSNPNNTIPAAPKQFWGWKDKAEHPNRTDYLDPSAPDLFLAFSPAPGISRIADADLSIYDAGLGVTTHVVSPRAISLTRIVKSGNTQKAIMITEDLDETWYRGVQLGTCWQGTPNGQDGCTVWTNRVFKDVYENCKDTNPPSQGKCRTPNSSVSVDRALGSNSDYQDADLRPLQILYLKNVVAHEASHTSNLKKRSSGSLGYHYAAESGVVMEKSIKVDAANYPPDVVYFISTTYASTDRADAALK